MLTGREILQLTAARLAREVRLWGQRLNFLASIGVGYLIANAGQFQAAVQELVPERFRSLAGMAAGMIVFAIVRAIAARDAKKSEHAGVKAERKAEAAANG